MSDNTATKKTDVWKNLDLKTKEELHSIASAKNPDRIAFHRACIDKGVENIENDLWETHKDAEEEKLFQIIESQNIEEEEKKKYEELRRKNDEELKKLEEERKKAEEEKKEEQKKAEEKAFPYEQVRQPSQQQNPIKQSPIAINVTATPPSPDLTHPAQSIPKSSGVNLPPFKKKPRFFSRLFSPVTTRIQKATTAISRFKKKHPYIFATLMGGPFGLLGKLSQDGINALYKKIQLRKRTQNPKKIDTNQNSKAPRTTNNFVQKIGSRIQIRLKRLGSLMKAHPYLASWAGGPLGFAGYASYRGISNILGRFKFGARIKNFSSAAGQRVRGFANRLGFGVASKAIQQVVRQVITTAVTTAIGAVTGGAAWAVRGGLWLANKLTGGLVNKAFNATPLGILLSNKSVEEKAKKLAKQTTITIIILIVLLSLIFIIPLLVILMILGGGLQSTSGTTYTRVSCSDDLATENSTAGSVEAAIAKYYYITVKTNPSGDSRAISIEQLIEENICRIEGHVNGKTGYDGFDTFGKLLLGKNQLIAQSNLANTTITVSFAGTGCNASLKDPNSTTMDLTITDPDTCIQDPAGNYKLEFLLDRTLALALIPRANTNGSTVFADFQSQVFSKGVYLPYGDCSTSKTNTACFADMIGFYMTYPFYPNLGNSGGTYSGNGSNIIWLNSGSDGQFSPHTNDPGWIGSQCGMASLAEVLNAYGGKPGGGLWRIEEIEQKGLDQHVWTTGGFQGPFDTNWKNFAISFGFQADYKTYDVNQQNLDIILNTANQGHPVIVGAVDHQHYLLVYKSDSQYVYTLDSSGHFYTWADQTSTDSIPQNISKQPYHHFRFTKDQFLNGGFDGWLRRDTPTFNLDDATGYWNGIAIVITPK